MDDIAELLALRPALRGHAECADSYAAYARDIMDSARPPAGSRLADAIVAEHARTGAPPDRLAALRRQLMAKPVFSSADHAGLLHYGILYHAHLLLTDMMERAGQPFAVTLASGRVPMDNISRPRGFDFDSRAFNFFGGKNKSIPACMFAGSLPAVKAGGFVSLLTRGDTWEQLDRERRRFLESLIADHLMIPPVPDANLFDWFACLNRRLAPLFVEEGLRAARPQLVYVSIERIVTRLLAEDLGASGSLPAFLVGDGAARRVVAEEFAAVAGCADGGGQFWRVRPGRGLEAWVPPEAGDGDPGSLAAALGAGELVPGLLWEMYYLAFAEGCVALGGFNQVDYLTAMRAAWGRALRRLGRDGEAERFGLVRTDGLVCGPLAFPQWPSSFDLLWERNQAGGRFVPGFRGGLTRSELDALGRAPLCELVRRGMGAMLEVVR